MQTDFYFDRRRYTCQIVQVEDERELRIGYPTGEALVIRPRQQQGLLKLTNGQIQAIAATESHYFNLIRFALASLEQAEQQRLLAQKDQLLAQKDELLVAKDQQISSLTQQVTLLTQELHQLSTEQQTTFQTLEAEVTQKAQMIQEREAQIQTLEHHIGQQVTLIDAEDIKYRLQDLLGKRVWHQLDARSKKDLHMALRNHERLRSEQFTAQVVDYSEIGLRLGFVVEREVVRPFFRDLYEFVLERGTTEVGGVVLSPTKHYTLGMVPPLLATQWYSFRDRALKQGLLLSEADLYCTISFNDHRISTNDRKLIRRFLKTWRHPLGRWFRKGEVATASTIDQINKLRNIAAHAESFLYEWQFDLLRSLVLGDDNQPGLLQALA